MKRRDRRRKGGRKETEIKLVLRFSRRWILSWFTVVIKKRGLDWMIGFIDHSFTITRNNNKSSAEPFFLDYRILAPFWFFWLIWVRESELLYDWRFTANQFVLAPSPLRLKARFLFQLNTCGNSPYVTFSLTRRLVCLLWICFAS
jgi:hypothetical protein